MDGSSKYFVEAISLILLDFNISERNTLLKRLFPTRMISQEVRLQLYLVIIMR